MDNLEKRVKDLEKRVGHLEENVGVVDEDSVMATVKQKSEVLEDSWVGQLFKWLAEDWLMKLGALLLILSFSWFVTYAFAGNWIGPMGRISIGMLAGVGVLFFGDFLMQKKRVAGEVLVVTGMAILILSIFSGNFFYDFFGFAGLGMMSLVVALVAVIAVMRDSKSLAVSSFLAAVLLPLFIGKLDSQWLFYLAYFLAVDLAVLLVVVMKKWRALVILSFIMTAIYASILFDSRYIVEDKMFYVWLFMGFYYTFFLLSNVVSVLKKAFVRTGDVVLAGFNSLLILAWVLEYVPEEWQVMTLSALALLSFFCVHFLLQNSKVARNISLIYGALAFLFVGVATGLQLDGEAMVIAFSLESFVAVLLVAVVLKDRKLAAYTGLLHLMPVLMAFKALDAFAWRSYETLLNKDFFIVLVEIVSLFATYTLLRKMDDKKGKVFFLEMAQVVVASIFSIGLLWQSLHVLIETDSVARGVALVILTIIGVSIFFYSLSEDKRNLHIASAMLLGAVVLRLLFVEVWEMSLVARVVTFLAVGILLIITAFISKRK